MHSVVFIIHNPIMKYNCLIGNSVGKVYIRHTSDILLKVTTKGNILTK